MKKLMNNLDYLINNFYIKYCDDDFAIEYISYSYLNDNVTDINLKKVQMVLSAFHNDLNYYFDRLNSRIKGNRYFPAHDSRELLYLINDVFEFCRALKNSNYSFTATKQCYALLKKAENFLKERGGTEIPDDIEPLNLPKHSPIFESLPHSSTTKKVSEDLIKIIYKVSNNDINFTKMSIDEKLEKLNMAIEYLLKFNGKYIQIKYEKIFGEFVNEQDIISYRKTTNCFRHGSKDSLKCRSAISEKHKIFLVDYGSMVCNCLFQYFTDQSEASFFE